MTDRPGAAARDTPPGPGSPDWPSRQRSRVLPALLAAMLAIGAGSGAFMLWHRPLPPDADGGPRCARLFDARLHGARGGTDADLLALSDAALAAGCGRQAFDAAEAVGGGADDVASGGAAEAAAWRLARFYDPGETAPVYRQALAPRPAAAAALYAAWAARSPRMAEALRRLCAGAARPGACGG